MPFVVLAYENGLVSCTTSRAAPSVELEYLEDMEMLQEAGTVSVAKKTQIAMKRRFWYFSKALVGLTFFDKKQKLKQVEKRRMHDNV